MTSQRSFDEAPGQPPTPGLIERSGLTPLPTPPRPASLLRPLFASLLVSPRQAS